VLVFQCVHFLEPVHYKYPDIKPKVYLNDYISSYLEKDIVLAAGIQKVIPFRKFLKLLAGRVGHVLDVSYFAKILGLSSTAINGWLSILEKMHLIVLVQPFSSNLSKRLVKSPKIYFIDTGLACRLQGWSDSVPILSSPAQGFLFENVVFGEIFKFILNYRLDWDIFHWRSKDKREIDFLVQTAPDQFIFIEAKVSRQRLKDIHAFPEVKKIFKEKIPKRIQCVQEGESILGDVIPVRYLHDFLKRFNEKQI